MIIPEPPLALPAEMTRARPCVMINETLEYEIPNVVGAWFQGHQVVYEPFCWVLSVIYQWLCKTSSTYSFSIPLCSEWLSSHARRFPNSEPAEPISIAITSLP
jgi:hypothetical protein